MALGDLLPGFLQRSDDADDGVLRECRHCGSKFDEPVDRCRVCEATEIATYEFVTASSDTDESVEGQPTGSREDGSDAPGDETIEEDGDSEREPEPGPEPEPDRGDHEDRPDGGPEREPGPDPEPDPERDDRS
ncbi:hypothetical protein SAMN05444422_101318 [Halobiforma haloterrestris]|uniref:Uncharacterized protein n=1 Tax=Natronobacterium haloterrestre TaxID=148448 RepID=A0A1I1DBS2_NATHA|nr:hypothetical protein [Halobiforma haloterrestris]SFB70240.1 hypothetical protein SAMN05444422_101318 [Halobiforma haloterrestris]